MIANYGYRDAEGEFYITIDQDKCSGCSGRPCVAACPEGLLVVEEDPYGEAVAAVDDRKRRQVKYECMGCKPTTARRPLACESACPFGAIRHSW